MLTGPELELRMRLLRSYANGQSSWRSPETLEKPDEAPDSKSGLRTSMAGICGRLLP